jgi:deaminated glutathione amidase
MRIALIQMTSVLNPEENIAKINIFLKEAKQNGVQAVFLPEVFYSLSDGLKPTPHVIEKSNSHYEKIKKLATENSLYILGGSAATKGDKKLLNRSYNFSPTGEDLGFYDKKHLFACDLSKDPSKQVLNESELYEEGHELKMIEFEGFKLGLSICFDLRFPELFRYYSSHGANILSISSAFTVPTGKAHWHTLVRARAIENQCYVVASGQWGTHNDRIKTYGHSLIVDPWGEVLVDAGEGEKMVWTDITHEKLKEARARIDVLRDPRHL